MARTARTAVPVRGLLAASKVVVVQSGATITRCGNQHTHLYRIILPRITMPRPKSDWLQP